MIIYFSATGNCEFVAKSIASNTEDYAISMTEIKDKICLQKGEQLGIVCPTYFWRLPSFVDDFLQKIEIENAKDSYIFFVTTYGTTCGQTDFYLANHLSKKGLKLLASYGIKTVDNWTVEFNVNDKKMIEKTLNNEQSQTKNIIENIKAKKTIFIDKDKRSRIACWGAQFFYEQARKTKHLNVNDNCVGCGACQNNCPVSAISIQNGKPTWILDKCVMCFKCLHHCPTFAINFDNKTQKNGQYVHPKFNNI